VILARSTAGAEVAARFSVGETASIVDTDLSEASRKLLRTGDADLILVEHPTSDDGWLSEALALTRECLRPGSEIRIVIDAEIPSTPTEDVLADAFSGWMVTGATVDAGVLALHVRPSSDDAEPETTRESVQGALQIAAMLRTVVNPTAENLPEFEVRSSNVMSYLRQVPRLRAETETLRRELRDRETLDRRREGEAGPTVTGEDGVQEAPPAKRETPGRRSSRGRKLMVAVTAAAVIAAGAWLVTIWLNLDSNGYLSLLLLAAIAVTLYDVRRRFIRLTARTSRLAQHVERGFRRTASQIASLKGTVVTEGRRARARADEVKALDIDIRALTSETAATVRAIEASQLRTRETILDVSRTIQTYAASVETESKRMADTMEKGSVAKVVRAELVNAYNQIESNLRLRDLVDVTGPTPQLRGWAASPDVIAFLVREMRRIEPGVVLECGSGASTVWLAMAARTKGLKTRVVALEHDEVYASETTRLLEECGVDDIGEVRLAPIEEVEVNGHRVPWYSQDALSGLTEIGLVFVDGPPGNLGPRSRYPALPILRSLLADEATVVLDDLIREEERQTMTLWGEEFPEMEVSELRVEKGAAVFRLGSGRDT
jgi:predicted O-methyltransferase YrrM